MEIEEKAAQKFNQMYDSYDRYLYVPAILVVAALTVLGGNFALNGQFVNLGTDFTGGTEITYQVGGGQFSPQEAEDAFANSGRPGADATRQTTGNTTRLLVELPPPQLERDEARQILTAAGIEAEVESFRSINASVSEEFFTQAGIAFGLAFSVMSVVIFVAFRDAIPSLAVVFAATADIVFALAGMALFGIPLTLGTLAALLMLIGYSVDTDIVLSTRVLKRERGSLKSRVWSSIKTGTTMSSGGIAGFLLLYLVSLALVGPSELSNIAAVMVIGLAADMPITWLGNAIVLKKYVNGDYDGVVPWS
nr:MAG: preprotein translocase subunit SecF [Candidatus Nanosalinarum sp. J07AB56]